MVHNIKEDQEQVLSLNNDLDNYNPVDPVLKSEKVSATNRSRFKSFDKNVREERSASLKGGRPGHQPKVSIVTSQANDYLHQIESQAEIRETLNETERTPLKINSIKE